jgi:hypothetical protein
VSRLLAAASRRRVASALTPSIEASNAATIGTSPRTVTLNGVAPGRVLVVIATGASSPLTGTGTWTPVAAATGSLAQIRPAIYTQTATAPLGTTYSATTSGVQTNVSMIMFSLKDVTSATPRATAIAADAGANTTSLVVGPTAPAASGIQLVAVAGSSTESSPVMTGYTIVTGSSRLHIGWAVVGNAAHTVTFTGAASRRMAAVTAVFA